MKNSVCALFTDDSITGCVRLVWPALKIHAHHKKYQLSTLMITRASVKLFELERTYAKGSIYGVGLRYTGGIDFWQYRTPSLLIFGIISGLLETTKMYKFF